MAFSPFEKLGIGNAFGGILGGLFGNSDEPYEAAGEQYQKYGDLARQTQQPFFNAGTQAIPAFQNWLQSQSNPSQFINNLMGQYQQSPWAQYMQQQSMRAGQNYGSANGLSGSTPLMMQLQQNAGNISSEDMGKWLKNVLGINTQYGQGQQSLIQGGQSSANALTNMYGQMGENMANAEYGREAGREQDKGDIFGGLGSLLGFFL